MELLQKRRGTVIPHMKEHQLFQVYQHLPDGRFMNGYGETALTVSQQDSDIDYLYSTSTDTEEVKKIIKKYDIEVYLLRNQRT